MGVNRGKQFEHVVREAFEAVPDTVVVRLPDQTNGYAGSKNPCDFLVYHLGHFYGIECKTVHGNTLPFANITDYQYSELLKLASVRGCFAGILCWWVDKDITFFVPIEVISILKMIRGNKSIRYDDVGMLVTHHGLRYCIPIPGKKKRVFFDYDMAQFFKEAEECIIPD